jgi:hypothetical protein
MYVAKSAIVKGIQQEIAGIALKVVTMMILMMILMPMASTQIGTPTLVQLIILLVSSTIFLSMIPIKGVIK